MSVLAPETFSIMRQAADPRADGAVRTVRLSATAVTIDRAVRGVRMRLGIPVAVYRDLVISLHSPTGRATLKLRHADSELDVEIGSGDAQDVARSARAWGRLVGKAIAIEDASVVVRPSYPRLRRSRFARKRTAGDTTRMRVRFAGEREIIARN